MNKKLVKGFVTHSRMHGDEELALLLLKLFGDRAYEFSDDCEVHYVTGYLDPEDFTVFGRSILRLGVGGGIYDDHGRGEDRRACCQLVAENLEVADKPGLIKLVELVAHMDKNLVKNNGRGMTLPRLIKMAHRYGKTPEQVRAWVRCAFEALIASEEESFEKIRSKNKHIQDRDARRELNRLQFLKDKRPWETMVVETIAPFIPQEDRRDWMDFVREVQQCQQHAFAQASKYARENVLRYYSATCGRHLKVLVADATGMPECSMHLELDAACRLSDIQADFLLLRNPGGNTMIVANKSAHADLRMFVVRLRKREASRRGKSIGAADLLKEGTIPGHEHWHVLEGTEFGRVNNGTETRPDVEKSILPFEEIVQIFSECMMLQEEREVLRSKAPTAA